MNNIINNFFIYISKLAHKGYLIASVFLFIMDILILFVTLPDDLKLNPGLLASIGMGILVIGSYEIWLNEKKEKELIKDELTQFRNQEVKYEIKYDFKPIHLDFEKNKVEEELKKISTNLDPIRKLITPNLITNSWLEYEDSLKLYEKKLNDYIELSKDVYCVFFNISNTSQLFDSDINIIITPVENFYFLPNYINDKPEFPEYSDPFESDRVVIPGFHQDNTIPYRRINEHTENYLNITLQQLKAGEENPVINDGIFCKVTNGFKLKFHIKILSKSTKFPINNIIEINLN